MKINSAGISKILKNYANQKQSKNNKAAKQQKDDQLSVSKEALQLQKAKKKMGAASKSRQEKVAKIKAQVKQGSYNVAGEDIAEKMLNKAINKQV